MSIRKAVVAGLGAAALAASMSTGAFAVFDNASNGNTTGNSTSGAAVGINISTASGGCTQGSTNGTGGVQVVSRSGSHCGNVSASQRVANHTHSGNAHSGNTRVDNGNHL